MFVDDNSQFTDGPSFNFDLSNPEHAKFLLGIECGTKLNLKVIENTQTSTTVMVDWVDPETHTVWFK